MTRVDLYGTLNTCDLDVKIGEQYLPNGSGICDFGSVELYNTYTKTFIIANSGFKTLTVTCISFASGDTSQFIIDASSTSSSVPPGGNTTFDVIFKPTSIGYKTAVIRLSSNSSESSTYTFTVTGYGESNISEPDITVKQGTADLPDGSGIYDFGSIEEGASSAPVTITVSNNGNADLSISVVTFNSGDSDQFSIIASELPTILFPGTSTTFTVTFFPTSAGYKSAEVRIFNDDPDENPYTFTVSGYSEPAPIPEIVIMQGENELSQVSGSFDFGHVLSSSSSAPALFSIENTGTAELTIEDITLISGDTDRFILDPLPSSPVAPGGTTTFEITFTPFSSGFFSAVVEVETNDPDENPFNFTVTGYGDSSAYPDISLPDVDTSNIYDLGTKKFGETFVKKFTIKNVGTGNLFISSISLTGGQTTQFRLDVMTMSSNIAPGDDTKFSVEFVPTETGDISADVEIDTNDPDEDPFVFTVTGTGEPHPIPDIALYRGSTYYADGSTFDFGTVFFSESKTFTIKNTGDEELIINNILLMEGNTDFYLDTTSTSFFIPQGSSTSFTVFFDPVGLGDKWRNLIINSNDPNESPYNLRLEGNY
jgi:hypothetical protein